MKVYTETDGVIELRSRLRRERNRIATQEKPGVANRAIGCALHPRDFRAGMRVVSGPYSRLYLESVWIALFWRDRIYDYLPEVWTVVEATEEDVVLMRPEVKLLPTGSHYVYQNYWCLDVGTMLDRYEREEAERLKRLADEGGLPANDKE